MHILSLMKIYALFIIKPQNKNNLHFITYKGSKMLTKNQLFEILLDWNYWDREFPKTIQRKSYEKQIAKLSQSDKVVVIKGVRHCGKSTLLMNEYTATKSQDNKTKVFLTTSDCNIKQHFVNH